MSLTTLLVLIAVFVLLFGGFGWGYTNRANPGYAHWSPLGVVVLIIVVLLIFGRGYL